jgi:hypothetical protein
MDRGIWATWYDVQAAAESEYLDWLHAEYLPAMLQRPGYLWAAHVRNITDPEREASNYRRLTHTDDAAVPQGFGYLLMFGGVTAHTFTDPSPQEMLEEYDEAARRMLGRREGERSIIFVEVARVAGPGEPKRIPGVTPGPIIQFGTFNVRSPEEETEMSSWYARSRLPLVGAREGNVGARKLVSISGWPRHGILYEVESLEAAATNLVDPSDWSRKVVDSLVHAPHSPTLGTRIWPEVRT